MPRSATLVLCLAEPVVFVHPNGQNAVLALLNVQVDKPTKITNIDVRLVGKTRTEWPEGIPPQYSDHSEEAIIVDVSQTLFPNALSDLPSLHQFRMSSTNLFRGLPSRDISRVNQPPPYDARQPLRRLRSNTNDVAGPSTPYSPRNQRPPSFHESDPSCAQSLDSSPEPTIFPKGTYTFPISIPLPTNSTYPSSVECNSGWVRYTLEARIHRSGILASKLTTSIPVNVVNVGVDPQSLFTGAVSSIGAALDGVQKVEWSVQSAKECFIGGEVPISIKARLKDHRTTLGAMKIELKETVAYYAHNGTAYKRDPIRTFPLIVQHNDVVPPTHRYDSTYQAQVKARADPWSISHDVSITMPSCPTSRVKISTRAQRARIRKGEQAVVVSHALSVVLTLSMPDGRQVDVRVGELDVDLLSCHLNRQTRASRGSCGCRASEGGSHLVELSPWSLPLPLQGGGDVTRVDEPPQYSVAHLI